MALLTWNDKADIHREVCVAILDAFVPHGQRGKFIKSVGYTKQWYSYIRQANSFRMPSLETARKIAENLPAPKSYQQAFFHHLAEARKAYEAANQEVFQRTAFRQPVDDYLQELKSSFSEATFDGDMYEARDQYRRVLEQGKVLITNLHPDIYFLEYLEVCSLMAHACYVLDNAASGLYWAKLGRCLAEDYETFNNQYKRQRLDNLRFLLARDEALGYHNLKNPKLAQQYYNRAETLLPNDSKIIRLADVYRNRLISLSTLPRFTVGKAAGLAGQAEKVFEKRGDELSLLLNNEALARAYIVYGSSLNLRRAKKLLHYTQERLDLLPNAGPLHSTVVLITKARLHWHENDRSSWEHTIKEALTITTQAGLFHQHRKIVKEYGEALVPFLKTEHQLHEPTGAINLAHLSI